MVPLTKRGSNLRLLLGISLYWLALSMLSDGLNTLVLPERVLALAGAGRGATVLGLLSFFGLAAGMLVMPAAGQWSDRLRARWGRRGLLGLGTLLTVLALILLAFAPGLAWLAAAYLLVQVTASIAQAAQQGFLPDLVPPGLRGMASGLKSFMDLAGAAVGFILLGELLGAGRVSLALGLLAGMLAAAFGLTAVLVRETPGSAPPAPARSPFALDLKQHRAFAWLVVSRFAFLLGTYAVGRFLVLFVAGRLQLGAQQAAGQAGGLLAGLALVTVAAAPLAGWLADRVGRKPVMLAGSLVSTAGVLLLILAGSAWQILLFGALLSLGSAAFASANWAMTADVVPENEAARFFGLANFGTAGAAAAAGLFGPLVDGFNRLQPGLGFNALFIAAALAFVLSAAVLRAKL